MKYLKAVDRFLERRVRNPCSDRCSDKPKKTKNGTDDLIKGLMIFLLLLPLLASDVCKLDVGLLTTTSYGLDNIQNAVIDVTER